MIVDSFPTHIEAFTCDRKMETDDRDWYVINEDTGARFQLSGEEWHRISDHMLGPTIKFGD